MGKLDRELIAALDDLIGHYQADVEHARTPMDSVGSANRLQGALEALEQVRDVLTEGYVYYSLDDAKLIPAAYWVRLDGGAWMAAAANEQRMPWDEIAPISQLPLGVALVYRNKYRALVDPRLRVGFCMHCGLNPKSDGFEIDYCATPGKAHELREEHHDPGGAD